MVDSSFVENIVDEANLKIYHSIGMRVKEFYVLSNSECIQLKLKLSWPHRLAKPQVGVCTQQCRLPSLSPVQVISGSNFDKIVFRILV